MCTYIFACTCITVSFAVCIFHHGGIVVVPLKFTVFLLTFMPFWVFSHSLCPLYLLWSSLAALLQRRLRQAERLKASSCRSTWLSLWAWCQLCTSPRASQVRNFKMDTKFSNDMIFEFNIIISHYELASLKYWHTIKYMSSTQFAASHSELWLFHYCSHSLIWAL